ncbi:DUF7342 family protein [Halomarina pelagica]|uniref:DUF7342 family protein n=1 Tax=Halomarina pelagica TaxID=2961599 RepID=UPI0020C277EF|nr:hypothetical protein [Halomarina sp. BND7]
MDPTDTPNVRDTGDEPPDFDEWDAPDEVLKGGSTRERMLDVILQLREPTKVSEIANRAGCDTETARDYLVWFAEMGIVREHAGRPVRYDRNESYLRWRQIERIRSRYSESEIVEKLKSTVDGLEEYRARFDADHPDEVSLVAASRERPLEEAWEALSEWQTMERRADLLDAARRSGDLASGDVGRVDA